MSSTTPVIIQLIRGAPGGNIAGSISKKISLATVNYLPGNVGGGLREQLLRTLGVAGRGSGTDLSSLIGSIIGRGVGSRVLMAVSGVIKNAVGKK